MKLSEKFLGTGQRPKNHGRTVSELDTMKKKTTGKLEKQSKIKNRMYSIIPYKYNKNI